MLDIIMRFLKNHTQEFRKEKETLINVIVINYCSFIIFKYLMFIIIIIIPKDS